MRTWNRFCTMATTPFTVVALYGSAAFAEVEYPYCMTAPGGWGSGFTSCGFITMAQCRATASGDGGWCHLNPAYRERASRGEAARARSRDPAQRR